MHYLEAKRRAELVERKAISTLASLEELEKKIRDAPFAQLRAARIAGIKDILRRVDKQEKEKWKLEAQPETFWVSFASVRLTPPLTPPAFILRAIPPDLPREETASLRWATLHYGTLGMPYSSFREVLSTLESEVADGDFDSNLRDAPLTLVISRFKQAVQARAESLT